jgi:hypothetical protein
MTHAAPYACCASTLSVCLLRLQVPTAQQTAGASPTTASAAFAHALLSLLGPATAVFITAAAAAAGTWYVAVGGFGSSRRRVKRVTPLKGVQEEADKPGGSCLGGKVVCSCQLSSAAALCGMLLTVEGQ